MTTFHKTDEPTALRFEVAGLRWLARATEDGGAPVVGIVAEGQGWLDLVHLHAGRPTAGVAAAFGRGLARTHAAGAPSLGCTPPGWTGEVLRSSGPMPLPEHDAEPVFDSWGAFYADYQIRPYIPRALRGGAIDDAGARVLERVADRLAAGELDHEQPALVGSGAARLHGDLWGGNVVWARRDGAVEGFRDALQLDDRRLRHGALYNVNGCGEPQSCVAALCGTIRRSSLRGQPS